MNPDLLAILVSPHDHTALHKEGDELVSAGGHRYPVMDGVPVLLRDDVSQTLWVAQESIRLARNAISSGKAADPFFIATLGLTDHERKSVETAVIAWHDSGRAGIDPVASYLVAATSGYLYKVLQGRLDDYPIPELRLPLGNGKRFLEIGCNWGRWIVAAGRAGYSPIGIDPSLGAVLAAKRISRHLGIDANFVIGDGRYLPIGARTVDVVFSYSVMQHFSKEDAHQALRQVRRVLVSGGESLIQMPNQYGVRSAFHLARRGFREAKDFDVRYYGPNELKRQFDEAIGASSLSVDGYFGLGIQKSDYAIMPPFHKIIILASETLRMISHWLPPLKYIADSLYVHSKKHRDD